MTLRPTWMRWRGSAAGTVSEVAQGLAPQEEKRWRRIGVLAAFAMALGYLETFIPIPIPGVKLGLANIAVLVALALGDIPGAFCIGIVKVLAAGLLFGNPLTMAYSAAGTALALLAMAPLSRLATLRLEMLSVAGAVAHEMGQLAVAMLLLGTPLVWYSAPALLLAGCATGLLCGIVAARTVPLLQAADQLVPVEAPDAAVAPAAAGAAAHESSGPASSASRLRQQSPSARISLDGRAAIVVFLLYCLAVLHASQPGVLLAALAVAGIAGIAGRVRLRTLLLALRPLALILAITAVAQVASQPPGTVAAEPFGIAITWEALELTAVMFLRLLAITIASIAFMYLVTTQQLVEAASWLLGPLRRLGVRTEGFALALQTALQTVPLLADEFGSQAEGLKGQVASREFWRTTLPAAIARCYQCIDLPTGN